MNNHYTAEKNVQMLISLLKAHGIKKVIASPGSTNATFVASIQQDDYFEMYSCVDERSAAYMACGMAAECGEPVALSCTAATASRNYMPGLTEAFYRKLPILAITSTRHLGMVGQNMDQVIDRSVLPKDIAKKSISLPMPVSENDIWAEEVQINDALLELKRHGGGPVHINLVTTYDTDFSFKKLPPVRVIHRIGINDDFPELKGKSIGIFIGAHRAFTTELTDIIERFCEKYNAVVLCDQTSNYFGKYAVYFNLITYQQNYHPSCKTLDVLIHIGEISASYYGFSTNVWRVSSDGEIRDTFKKLQYVFEMEELQFFIQYTKINIEKGGVSLFEEWNMAYEKTLSKLKEEADNLSLSNIWSALVMFEKVPINSIMHFGILNSLRTWNFFKLNPEKNIACFSNTGGFGTDGGISSMIGASLINKDKLFFGVFGDLAFFYDMNSLGNRHIGGNLRLLIINNGLGTEFKNNLSFTKRAGIDEDTDMYIAAAGHFGKQSRMLVKNYAEALGLKYYSAVTKEDFLDKFDYFLTPNPMERSIIFELFIDNHDDTNALEIVQNLQTNNVGATKELAKKILGDKGVKSIKKLLKK